MSRRSSSLVASLLAASLATQVSACGGDTQTNTGGGGATSQPQSSGSSSSAGGAATGGSGGAIVEPCAPPPVKPIACADLTDAPVATWSYYAEDGAPTSLAAVPGGPSGVVIAVDTQAGFGFSVRHDAPADIDASAAGVLQLAVRASNLNEWQINSPVVVIEDAAQARRTYAPTSQRLPRDGVTWTLVEVPLAGGPGWDVSGDVIDLARVRAVEIATDTWDYGYRLDLDAVSFKPAGAVCDASCPNDCSGRGTCDVAALRCVCPVGATGDDCGACAEGFVDASGACALASDGVFDVWPNAVSKANGDPWLAVHHDEIARLEPRLLVLHFVNKSDPATATIVKDVIAGFADGSRHHAYEDASAEPQLAYRIERTVDLRDGVNGHPPAPAGFPYENSTFYPRKGPPGAMELDYAALFTPAFAAHYGYPDPESPGAFLDLCALVEQGIVHEVWIVASGDVPDAPAYEVLESKQRYTPEGNKVPGSFEPCAGNGCFAADVPVCKRSVRIGFVNYNRGPGCYMHSQGHGLESTAVHRPVPALSNWFLRFAALDLDTRHGLPFDSLYAMDCQSPPCVAYPTPTKAVFTASGQPIERDPFDAVCGNVHFPPNGREHYDYAGPDTVLSTCASFGKNDLACGVDAASDVTSTLWEAYEAAHGDCGGGFLTWWYQSMPAHGSGKRFADGRPMRSVWPFLFY